MSLLKRPDPCVCGRSVSIRWDDSIHGDAQDEHWIECECGMFVPGGKQHGVEGAKKLVALWDRMMAAASPAAEPAPTAPIQPSPQPDEDEREAMVRLLQIITRNGSLDDGRTLHEVIADALLAAGWRRTGEMK